MKEYTMISDKAISGGAKIVVLDTDVLETAVSNDD